MVTNIRGVSILAIAVLILDACCRIWKHTAAATGGENYGAPDRLERIQAGRGTCEVSPRLIL
jgi:hypothetical protein